MLKTMDWNKELEKLNENFSNEAALKIYNDKFAEFSQPDLHRDKPTLIKRIAKTAFYTLGAAAGLATFGLVQDSSALVQIPSILAGMAVTSAFGMSALQSGHLLFSYAHNGKEWVDQETKKMAGMTDEEKNAYKIAYVKSDMEFKANKKVLGINGFHYDSQNLAKNSILSGVVSALPVAIFAAPVAAVGYVGVEAVKDKIKSMREKSLALDNSNLPRNTI